MTHRDVAHQGIRIEILVDRVSSVETGNDVTVRRGRRGTVTRLWDTDESAAGRGLPLARVRLDTTARGHKRAVTREVMLMPDQYRVLDVVERLGELENS